METIFQKYITIIWLWLGTKRMDLLRGLVYRIPASWQDGHCVALAPLSASRIPDREYLIQKQETGQIL